MSFLKWNDKENIEVKNTKETFITIELQNELITSTQITSTQKKLSLQ